MTGDSPWLDLLVETVLAVFFLLVAIKKE